MMYKIQKNVQLTFEDFDQPMALSLNPNNRWIKKQSSSPGSNLNLNTRRILKTKKEMSQNLFVWP